MSRRLLRATGLVGLPVVTVDGESPLEVKDAVFDRSKGCLVGFTLRRHGFLGSPVDEALAIEDVRGFGPDAVVIDGADAFQPGSDLQTSGGGDVIGDRVLTVGGTDLGEVVEVILLSGTAAEVVGFEVETGGLPADGILQHDPGTHIFLPLPRTTAISDENILVPDEVIGFIRDDLSGFGAAVEQFRDQLDEGGA